MPEYKVNKELIVEHIENGITLFDPDESYIFSLNETGAYIFSKVKTNTPVIKIVKAFEKKYSISNAKAKKDVDSLLARLVKNKIISYV